MVWLGRSSGQHLSERRRPANASRQHAMPAVAIFSIATCAAVLMLIASVRALTWHKVSPFLNSILLLLVLFVTWQVVAHSGPIAPEQWILFVLCALVGMLVGLM